MLRNESTGGGYWLVRVTLEDILWNLEVKRMVRAKVCILYTREGRRLVRTNLA